MGLVAKVLWEDALRRFLKESPEEDEAGRCCRSSLRARLRLRFPPLDVRLAAAPFFVRRSKECMRPSVSAALSSSCSGSRASLGSFLPGRPRLGRFTTAAGFESSSMFVVDGSCSEKSSEF